MKKITWILLLSPILLWSKGYFYQDKQLFVESKMILAETKFQLEKEYYQSLYKNKAITFEDYNEKIKKSNKDYIVARNNVFTIKDSFDEFENNHESPCHYSETITEIDPNNLKYYGLWHLNYINSLNFEDINSKLAIIDGHLSTNKLLPNLSKGECVWNNKKVNCDYGWNSVTENSDIFNTRSNHSYWVTSLIAGHNCKNEDSYYQQLGVNPLVNVINISTSEFFDGDERYSLDAVIKAILFADQNNVNVIYTPLIFKEYTEDEKQRYINAVSVFLSKQNRAFVGVFGNKSSVSIDDTPLPCVIDNVICVGGLNIFGGHWDGAIKSSLIDIYAPAQNLTAGLINNSRITQDGVSGAGAIVAGMISKIILNKAYKSDLETLLSGKKLIISDQKIDPKNKGISF